MKLTVKTGMKVSVGDSGIGPETYAALKDAGLSATIIYPDGKFTTPPEDNLVRDLLLSGQALKEANKYIKKHGDKWVIVQKGTGKVLSSHDSEEDAEASFRAMEMHKHEGAFEVMVETDEGNLEKVVEIIKATSASAKTKPNIVFPNQKPKAPEEKIISDQPKPVESAIETKTEDAEAKLFAALEVAELAAEMGITAAADKLTFISELEKETIEQIESRKNTLTQVKSAGLQKKSPRLASVRRMPNFASLGGSEEKRGNLNDVPDEGLYL